MAYHCERTYRCTTLLPDEVTICWKVVSSHETRCPAHREEYIRISRDCNALGDKVDSFKDGLNALRSPEVVESIRTEAQLRDAMIKVEAVLRPMMAEIAARKSQHARFCGNSMSHRLQRSCDCMLILKLTL